MIAILLLAAAPLLQDGEWVDVQFNRVHLRNGNFIDGQLIKDVPLEVTLLLKSGQMVIRRDQIDRVEFIKMRTRTEKPVVIPATGDKGVKGIKPPVDPRGDKKPAEVVTSAEVRRRIDEVVAKINAAKGEQKRFPIEDVQPLGDEGAVYLATKVRGLPLESQGVVATGLGLLKCEKTVPYLEEFLGDRDPKIRAIGVMGLGFMGDSYKVRYLRPALKDSNAEVRTTVLSMLSNVEDKDWFEPVSALCGDADPTVRIRALGLAGRLAKVNNMNEAYLGLLAGLLRDANEPLKIEFANVIAGLGEKKGWEFLAKLLTDSSAKVRFTAARGLMSLGAPEAGPDLLTAIGRESDQKTRIFLAGAAQKIRLRKAVLPLIEWLSDSDDEIKKVAQTALVAITGQPIGGDKDKWTDWASKQQDLR